MQIIKAFTYEIPFLKRLAFVRKNEMNAVRKILFIRAANQALAFSIPALASVLSFVVYTATHDNLDPAILFTSLSYFNLLRQPLMFLPRALSSLTDAQTAVERLHEFFEAPLAEDMNLVDPNLDVALRAKDASFQWATVQSPDQLSTEKGLKDARGKKGKKEKKSKKDESKTLPVEDGGSPSSEEPFAIEHLNMEVPRGQLVAIVGPVGSGKSSILQGLLGEMRHTGGSAIFGGRLGYCQQTAWIQNATLRDNIVFGQKWDESRYWQCVMDASLVTDLEILPDGDLTEIGEKGVNLSGGQKQRVNIARALYFDADIILFDDPLSAVDAHVGKALFNDAILGLRRKGKTVILVTHALHFLPQVDYIYTIQNGHVVEEGSYDTLMTSGAAFQKLMDEFGGQHAMKEEQEIEEEEDAIEDTEGPNALKRQQTNEAKIEKLTRAQMGKAAGTGKLEVGLSFWKGPCSPAQGRLMISEVRKTGSVGPKVYGTYLKAGQWWWTLPTSLAFGVLMQGASVMST